MNAKQVLKKLKQEGFEKVSQKGSHIKLSNGKRTAIVPSHGAKELPLGTLISIEKQSGIKLR